MTLIDAQWQHRKQYDLRGVEYDIFIRDQGDGAYQSAWVCSSCCEEGVLAPVGASVIAVIRLAQTNARVLHQLMHENSEADETKPPAIIN